MADPQKSWWQEYKPLIQWAVVALVYGLLAGLIGVQVAPLPPPQFVEVEKQVIVPVADELDPPATGWVDSPVEVAAVVESLPIKTFAATPAGAAQDLPKSVYGWKGYEKLYGRPPPVKDQGSVGSCVSFGTNTAVCRTLAAEILARGGQAEEYTLFAEEATYGGSRVEVGGGRIRGDGSVGAWAAKFVTQWGCVPRKVYPEQHLDLTSYSADLCRRWGKDGVPEAFEKVAREYPVKSTAKVTSWQDAKAAMSQGYFVAVCSDQGFDRNRDASGVAKPRGTWNHCMALDGYHTEGGKEYGHIENSWGPSYHVGPTGWGEPGPGGFWAESSVVDRMLRQGDSWTFSGVTGFPRRVMPLNWLILSEPRRARDPFADLKLAARPEVSLSW